MDDKAIHQHVLDELEFEPSIDAEHVGVIVEYGGDSRPGDSRRFDNLLETPLRTRSGWPGEINPPV